MPDLFNLSDDMQQYFDSLPKNIQQTIIMSGAKMNSLQDMKTVVKSFSQRTDNEEE